MNAPTYRPHPGSRLLALLAVLAIAQPAVAQQPASPEAFRANYDAMMSNFERLAAAMGDTLLQERARQGREAMGAVSDDQLATTFGQDRIPDLSVGVTVSRDLISRMESQQKAAEASSALEPLTPGPLTPGLPGPPPLVGGCDGVDITAETRYDLLIIKEVANSILAAAAWVCNEDILGENGSAACIPLAIAADVANGFFDTATFCSGEVTANQVDANFNRLNHIHDDLAAVQATTNAIDTHITNVDAHIANEFSALDTHLANVDNHIAIQLTALDAHIVSLFANIGAQLNDSTALLSANLKQVMKLELTPEGRRELVPAILTCTGTNCPDVLASCSGPGGTCSWNDVGPLP
jgi:hypothetical protein